MRPLLIALLVAALAPGCGGGGSERDAASDAGSVVQDDVPGADGADSSSADQPPVVPDAAGDADDADTPADAGPDSHHAPGDADTGAAADSGSSEPTDYCSLGASVFDEGVLHKLELTLSDADWAAMITEANESEEYGGPKPTYFDAQLTFDGAPMDSLVAVRLKGHYSLQVAASIGHTYPLKVDFDRVDADLHLDGLTKLNLHPNLEGTAVLNELLSYGGLRAAGIPTARIGMALVTVNGEALGLYNLVEHMQGRFIRCHFDAPYGDLYKPEEPIGNLAWRGPDISDYEPEIQFKWPDASVTAHASLLAMLDVVNHEPIDAFGTVLDVDGVLTYLAANVAMGNFDYYATFGHNYYLYEVEPARFTMLPWDMNLSQALLDDPCGLGRNTGDWPITNKLLADPATVQQYLTILQSLLEGTASPTSLHAHLDSLLPLLSDHLDPEAVQALRERIDSRVSLQLAGIAGGVETCPAVPLEGGDDEACYGCLEQACDEPLFGCFEDEPCDCYLGCVSEDEGEDTCLAECDMEDTPPLFDELVACLVDHCSGVCL